MRNGIDFLVIGAQKCATTWLYECLAVHPALRLPPHKREVWYIGSELYQERGLEWYMGLFGNPPDDCLVGDVSVEYMHDQTAAGEIAEQFHDITFIASLRDPVDRAISAYFWNARKGILPVTSVDDALAKALHELRTNGSQGGVWADLVLRGNYAPQLQGYINHFGHEKIFLMLYEEIENDPSEVIRRVYRYLGVDENFKPRALSSRPKRNTHNPILVNLQRMMPGGALSGKAFDIANQLLAHFHNGSSIPEISEDLQKELREYYSSSIQQLEAIVASSPLENRPCLEISKVWDTAQ